ncbi:microviridin/marinostatin family tricyclic proteinase inhibitor [Taibaiella koreensis]|uniref:microviridin/marinostatin family tricyclic proteinase inhibitor n=1 Tax=Taibaiella koreensis TaxID=1268548 RepID=UPI000E59F2F9|nr:microviridin/marinostatin family tricyclic proteinase inhibitor [Taibaiella koreensis]
MKKEQGLAKPFFAGFLENQLKKPSETAVQGGQTLKFPSDLEEAQTNKYPSDQEDDVTKPAADIRHTDKYPSDGDEDGI